MLTLGNRSHDLQFCLNTLFFHFILLYIISLSKQYPFTTDNQTNKKTIKKQKYINNPHKHRALLPFLAHFFPGFSCSFVFICCAVLSCLVVSDSVQPHGLYLARLLCPWGFSRQDFWSGLPCPPAGHLPNLGIKPRSPSLQGDSLPSEPPGKLGNIKLKCILLLYLSLYAALYYQPFFHTLKLSISIFNSKRQYK